MPRILKNVIMVALIIILCVAMFFTVRVANPKNNFGREFNRERPENVPGFEEGRIAPDGQIPENGGFVRPENMPTGERLEKPEGEVEGDFRDFNKGNRENLKRTPSLSKTRIILCLAEAAGIAILTIYLILSKFNKLTCKETFENKTTIVTYIALIILVTAIITMLALLINKNTTRRGEFGEYGRGMMPEENVEKATKAEDVDSGENVTTEKINLADHTSNITITESGNYTLTGEFGYTVLIDAPGEVVLNLDNATVKNETTAALANISTNPLTINLLEGTKNVFSDGGSSEYDACVYSAGPLTIKGNGNLTVYGNQEEGEGIATETNDITIEGGNITVESNDDGLNAGGDGGTIAINGGNVFVKASGDGIDSNKNIVINGGYTYTIGSAKGGDAGVDADEGTTINGGELIALGSDMLEKPLNSSKQKAIASNLSTTIKSGSKITIKDSEGTEITTFTANEDFRTIIVSNSKLKTGTYSVYSDDKLIEKIECK